MSLDIILVIYFTSRLALLFPIGFAVATSQLLHELGNK